MGEMRGQPTVAKVPLKAKDADCAKKLWSLSEQFVNLHFD